MSSYCWSDRLVPWPILDESDRGISVEISGQPQLVNPTRIRGRCQDGDKLRVLVSGGDWIPAQVAGYNLGLKIEFLEGGSFRTQSVARLKFDSV